MSALKTLDVSEALQALVKSISEGQVGKDLISDFIKREFKGEDTGITSLATLNRSDEYTREEKDAFFIEWKGRVDAVDNEFFSLSLTPPDVSQPSPYELNGDYTPPEPPEEYKPELKPKQEPVTLDDAVKSGMIRLKDEPSPTSKLLNALDSYIDNRIGTQDTTPPDEDFIEGMVKNYLSSDEFTTQLEKTIKKVFKSIL